VAGLNGRARKSKCLNKGSALRCKEERHVEKVKRDGRKWFRIAEYKKEAEVKTSGEKGSLCC